MIKFSTHLRKISKNLELMNEINKFSKDGLNYLKDLKISKIEYSDLPVSTLIFKLKGSLESFRKYLTSGEEYNKEVLGDILLEFPITETVTDPKLQELVNSANVLTSRLLDRK